MEQVVVNNVPSFDGDNSHITWATTILDAAFSSNSFVDDRYFEAGNIKCVKTGEVDDDDKLNAYFSFIVSV